MFAMISNQEFYSEIEYVAVLSKKKRLFAVGRLAWSVETFRILIFCVLLIAMSWLSIVLTRDRGERTSVRS